MSAIPLAFIATAEATSLAVCAVVFRSRSLATWLFFWGTLALGVECVVEAMGQEHLAWGGWRVAWWVAEAVIPPIWLCFSLIYSRGNYGEYLRRWRPMLVISTLFSFGLALSSWVGLDGTRNGVGSGGEWSLARWYSDTASIFYLLTTVVVLVNLESTFRSAIGTARWRIKLMVLGLAVIFGARIYVLSQRILFSGAIPEMSGIQTGSLLIGCLLMAAGYARSGHSEVELYPSRTVLRASVTTLLTGGYLLIVGGLTQFAQHFGGKDSLQIQALVVLIGGALLAALLLSERLRDRLDRFVGRHFRRARYDFREMWSVSTERLASARERSEVCRVGAELISGVFRAMSVTIWTIDRERSEVAFGGSTSRAGMETPESIGLGAEEWGKAFRELMDASEPIDLEPLQSVGARVWKRLAPRLFSEHGGHRIALPLVAGKCLLGVAVLADRVDGTRYSSEDYELLKCMGRQIALALWNHRISEDLMKARELEAFQTMSTFFVHDLKNAASSLGLMLENARVYFDDPAFRKDALRGIGKALGKINGLVANLQKLRSGLSLERIETDLNDLITELIQDLGHERGITIKEEFNPVPPVSVDRQKLQSVVTNIILNARDAISAGGKITVTTAADEGRVLLMIADDGCGMTPEFVRESLFKPFQSTKQNGLGIGMFHSKLVVEAHEGTMQVESRPGKGTAVKVALPCAASR